MTRFLVALASAVIISIMGIPIATATTDSDHYTPCTGTFFDNCFVDVSHIDDRR